ncbi:MFS transporter [Sphingomonas sp. BGYR3]|uniref:MFS transporter n=1 Tax=Sphingomonas sp. BGYR3 TaxID=2975483 RepID=UPI0021A64FC4|nr:MFS transporter [Sphingomonas sp. BGYR3]MDG5489733.1 MFS transporter [Sphingomonas sp. BGYR3]
MSKPPHPFTLHNFRAYWLARLSGTLAQMAMVIVIGWQVYDIARQTMGVKESAFYLGLIGVAQFLPLLVLSLVAGWVADRVDRRLIARAALLLEAGCAAALAWMTWSGIIALPALFTIAALLGVARAFAGPSLSALAPNLVPAAVLPTAIAMSSVSWQTGAVLGPALGGYLYAANPALPYAVSAALFAFSVAMLSLVRPINAQGKPSGGNPWQQMVEGLTYVRRNRLVFGAISLDLFAVLFGGVTALLPVYARDILMVGSEGLGHLRGAPSLGAVLVAIGFSIRPLRNNVGQRMLWAVAVFGAMTALFGLAGPIFYWAMGPAAIGHDYAPGVALSLLALVVLGAADMISVYVRSSLIQLSTPDAMRGRVGAVSTLFISGSNELGEARAGFFAAVIGPVAATAVGGVLAVAITGLWAYIFPELRRARNFETVKTLEFPPVEPPKEKAQ